MKNKNEIDPYIQQQIDNIRIKPRRILKTALLLYVVTLILVYVNRDNYTDAEMNDVVTVGLYGIGGIVGLAYLFGLLSKYVIKLHQNKSHNKSVK